MRSILRVHRYIALLGLALALVTAGAQAAPEEPALSLYAPTSAALGEVLDLKARLTDAAGSPIANAPIVFTLPSTFFLGTTGDVVVGRGNTDKAGWAETQLPVQNGGSFTVRAEFRGNERYASAKTSATVPVEGSAGQLYIQEAGVRIPALGSPPEFGTSAGDLGHAHAQATGLAGLWPTMSFWPIGLAVAVVWSLYAFVVVQIFRIVVSAGRQQPNERSRIRDGRYGPYDPKR